MQRSSGSGPADREAFFSSLPADEFSTEEASLRAGLLEFLSSRPGFTLPLAEWIDRRLGGEIATLRDEKGQCEVRLIGGVGAEAFFESLPQDAFSPEEDALRDAIFDFLASWKSSTLAHLENLGADPLVKERSAALLPGDVKLDEWIEFRIGAEVQLVTEAKTGHRVIHLTAAARPIVAKKYEALQRAPAPRPSPGKGAGPSSGAAPPWRAGPSRAGPSAAGPGPSAVPPRRSPTAPGRSPPGRSPPASAPRASAKPEPVPRKLSVDREAWLAALPTDELSPEEAALREAVLAALAAWTKAKPMSLPELLQDAEVKRCRANLLPVTVQLREWVERRIGGEVELRKNDAGQTQVFLRSETAPETPAPRQPESRPPPGAAAKRAAEEFFSSLPEDELSEAELELRQALFAVVEASQVLSEVFKDPAVAQARAALMPEAVPLRQWVERRVGGEVEFFKDAKGVSCVRLREDAASAAEEPAGDSASKDEGEALPRELAARHGAAPGVGRRRPDAGRERFFEGLPADSFTADEETLRDALLAFLEGWKSADPPHLSAAAADEEVRKARAAVMPKGLHVPLREWIDRRMGGELEMVEQETTRQIYFGLQGTLDPKAIALLGADSASAAKKRPRDVSEPLRAGKGKRGKGGDVPWNKWPKEDSKGAPPAKYSSSRW